MSLILSNNAQHSPELGSISRNVYISHRTIGLQTSSRSISKSCRAPRAISLMNGPWTAFDSSRRYSHLNSAQFWAALSTNFQRFYSSMGFPLLSTFGLNLGNPAYFTRSSCQSNVRFSYWWWIIGWYSGGNMQHFPSSIQKFAGCTFLKLDASGGPWVRIVPHCLQCCLEMEASNVPPTVVCVNSMSAPLVKVTGSCSSLPTPTRCTGDMPIFLEQFLQWQKPDHTRTPRALNSTAPQWHLPFWSICTPFGVTPPPRKPVSCSTVADDFFFVSRVEFVAVELNSWFLV